MAFWIRALEGEYYVTRSLIALAMYMIRKAYSTIMENENTVPPVKHLAEALFCDFNQRYELGDKFGKIKYTSKPEVGYMKSYIGVHPYVFITALLDPRIKGTIHGSKKKKACIMTKDYYE